MGKIIKTDAEKVQGEDELRQLKSEINKLNNELSELADDLKFARLFEDAEEEGIIRSEKDEVIEERNKLYEKLGEIE